LQSEVGAARWPELLKVTPGKRKEVAVGKLVKLIVVLGIVAVAIYAVVRLSSRSGAPGRADSENADERPRLEEKYGFTTEQVGP
jgi:hypothetical protein